MNVNLKKIKKALFLILLSFSLGTFCIFPTSTSKYYSVKDSHLVYNIKYQQLEKNTPSLEVDHKNTNAPTTVGYIATFYRTNYALSSDKNDKYILNVDSGCTINSTSTSNATLSGSGNIKNLIYNNAHINSDLNIPIKVYYTCNANDIHVGNVLQTTFEIKEQFQSKDSSKYENKVYNIGKYTYSWNYDDFYIPPKPQPFIDENDSNILHMPKDYEDKYNWILTNFMLTAEEKKYFKSKYNANNITTSGLLSSFSVSIDPDNSEYYLYTKNTNFKSHAMTYDNNYVYYYFLDDLENEELLDLLVEYLKLSKTYTEVQIADIRRYVENSKMSLKALLNSTKRNGIKGIYNSGARYIKIEDSILTYANPPETPQTITLKFSEIKIPDIYINLPDMIAENSTISDANSEKLFADDNFWNVIEKTSIAQEEYNYLMYNDGSQVAVVVIRTVPADGHYITIYDATQEQSKIFNIPFLQESSNELTVNKINSVLNYYKNGNIETLLGFDENAKEITEVTIGMLEKPDSVMISIDNNGTITVSFTTKKKVEQTPPVESENTTSSSSNGDDNEDGTSNSQDVENSSNVLQSESQEN